MADSDSLPDDVICNILAYLPAKPLLRFRCVSKHWNSMLKEPNFMKLRSRKTIFIALGKTLVLIDDNVPNDDTLNLVVKRCYPLENPRPKRPMGEVIGTFNGIVLFRYFFHGNDCYVLYNPFTCAKKEIPEAPFDLGKAGYGFGYDEHLDDLKIVRVRYLSNICDVCNLKESSWSSFNTPKFNDKFIKFYKNVGIFANGLLYWIAYDKNAVLIVLDIKDMVFSEIILPCRRRKTLLGTLNGALCALHNDETRYVYDMWVMEEENQFAKIYSFKLPLMRTVMMDFPYALCILDSGRILMVTPSSNLIIYDPSKDSYSTLNVSIEDVFYGDLHVLEYVESLVSPSDMCPN